jgi:hypothetical protein
VHIGARPAVWEICAFSQKRPQEVQRISWRRHHPGVSIPSWTTRYCVVDGPLCRQTCWWLAGQPTALGRSLACVLQDVCLPHRSQALLSVDVLCRRCLAFVLSEHQSKFFRLAISGHRVAFASHPYTPAIWMRGSKVQNCHIQHTRTREPALRAVVPSIAVAGVPFQARPRPPTEPATGASP